MYGIEIQECRLFDDGRNDGPARLPCRKLGFAADDRRVASQPALIPALSERYFTIGKTAHNERRSSTGSGGTSPALLPRQGLALGAKPGQSYAPRVNKKSVALTIALASANSERLFDVP